MAVTNDPDLEREILRPLWKVHILHHAAQAPILGNWMLEELGRHGYRVSPGTLYPLLARMEKLGWLAVSKADLRRLPGGARPYRATAAGRAALREVRSQLTELLAEAWPDSRK